MAFGAGGVKLREDENREKAGDKQGRVYFVVVRRKKAGDVGLYVRGKDFQPRTFRVLERDKRKFVEGSWLVSLIWDPHVLLPF